MLFLTAILAVGMASMLSFRKELTKVMLAEENTLVERIADNVNQKLLALQRILASSASDITRRRGLLGGCPALPGPQHRPLRRVDRSVFYFSAQGVLLAERPFRAGRRGEDASWRPYIRDTIRTQQPVISEPFLTNVGDSNMVLVLTTPVFAKDGRMIAILSGSLGLTHPGMLGNVAKTRIGMSGYIFMTTGNGKLILDPDPLRLSKPPFPPLANALFDRALAGFDGTEESVDASGRAAFITYGRVPASNWMVAAVYPRDEALSAVNDLKLRFLQFLLLACVIVVGAIWALTRYTMRPLVSLTRHFSDYTGHEEIAPLGGDKGSGEIRALTNAFNRLTTRSEGAGRGADRFDAALSAHH